jgi:uncharacterized BrkB/YihY/UPF0761 family membrane protein
MGRFGIKTLLFLFVYTALMASSYRYLPEFTRLQRQYPCWVLSACWTLGTFGAFVPVAVRQKAFSNRFWYVFVLISTIGTWSGFWLLYFWGENEARRSVHYPGLGAVVFIVFAAAFSGLLSFILGWLVPNKKHSQKSVHD